MSGFRPMMTRILQAARAPSALTPEEVTLALHPQGGVTRLERPDTEAPEQPEEFVASHEDLERELNDHQLTTLGYLREAHDQVVVDRYLPGCGTAWLVSTDFDDGGRQVTYHTLTRDGIPI